MYFKSRVEAGRMLAGLLRPKYRYENCAVVALGDGAVVVGAQVAAELHCSLMLMLTEQIKLPGESTPLAAVDQDGTFTYNPQYYDGELDFFEGEYHNYIDQERMEKFHSINRLVGGGTVLEKSLLRGHNVILVSDGLRDAMQLDAVEQYLKPVHTEKLIVATPIANVTAVDKMHILADEIYCLSVIDNYVGTDHYYDDNTVPDHETIIKIIRDIVLKWM